jgi:hypothetical protein
LTTMLEFLDNEETTEESLLNLIRERIYLLKESFVSDSSYVRLGYLAWSIALCYYLGSGSGGPPRDSKALPWVYIAAIANCGAAMNLFQCLWESQYGTAPVELTNLIWLVSGSFAGYLSTAACLKDRFPDLYGMTMSLHRRRYWGRSQVAVMNPDPIFKRIMAKLSADPGLIHEEVTDNWKHECGDTPLHFAAAIGHLDSLKLLLQDFGADIESTNAFGETPLFVAVRAGQVKAALNLIEKGAIATCINTDGMSIFHAASWMEDEEAASIAQVCFNLGGRLDLMATEMYTIYGDFLSHGVGSPLCWAAQKNRPSLFRVLVFLHQTYQNPGTRRG